jgi:receptor protein-tyrosine kinase
LQNTLARREPRLGHALTQTSAVTRGAPEPRSATRKAQRIDLDLPRLAAAGFLEPDDSESIIANEFRKIKRPLIQACQGKLAAPIENANRIMVTSSVPGEGKTFVALNLALSIAMERDSTVLLIDADTTRHSLSQLAGIDDRVGLLDLLAGGKVEVSDALLRTNVDRLALLPAGAPRRHATEMLASEAMEELVDQLASRHADRILVFDTPPLLGAPEPAVLATHMGQIIVVVEADKTTHKALTNALATIESCPLVTTVLNKTSSAESGYYYYSA